LEPIQGEGGYIVPPVEFLQEIRKICDEHGILMIVDEVQSGMGRTGKLFAIEHFGVKPDIITTAKGIASGLPLAAFIANESVMEWAVSAHGTTFGGNADRHGGGGQDDGFAAKRPDGQCQQKSVHENVRAS
jgi:4-aminobutyrate aminotransferase